MIDLPPLHPESYVQIRETAGEGITPFLAVRRSRINLLGQNPTDRVLIQLFFKDDNRSVTDAHLWVQDVALRHTLRQGTLTLGQFRPPFSRQRLTGDRELLLLERTTAVELIMPGGGMNGSFDRDIGVQWEPRPVHGWSAAVGLFRGNGTFQQAQIGSGGPLSAARLRWKTGTKSENIELGLALTGRQSGQRNFSKAFTGLGTFHGWDVRTGGELAAVSGHWHVHAEQLNARFFGTAGAPRRNARGGYLETACRVSKQVELAGQVQYVDPNTARTETNDQSAWTLGVNLGPRDHGSSWQVNYVARKTRQVQLQYQVFLTGG